MKRKVILAFCSDRKIKKDQWLPVGLTNFNVSSDIVPYVSPKDGEYDVITNCSLEDVGVFINDIEHTERPIKIKYNDLISVKMKKTTINPEVILMTDIEED